MTATVVTTEQYLGTAPIVVTGSRNLANQDSTFVLVYSGSGAITLTVPLNLNAGFGCAISQLGAGAVTIAAASGVTLANLSSQFATGGANAVAAVVQVGVNSYLLTGQTA